MGSATDTLRESIENRLHDNWSTTDIAWPGVDFTPPDGPWVQADLLGGEGFEYDRGTSRRNRIVGVLNLNLYDKPGEGFLTLYGYADTLRDLFMNIDVGTARFAVPSLPRRVPNEKWAQLNVTCPFTAEETTG